MTKFMRPVVKVDQLSDTVARYVVEPLDRGFGYTLGNCMRRVLLSSLEGAAATSIRIDGVQHEFGTIDGVREDITDIVLNVKGLIFQDTGIGEGEGIAMLSVEGPRVVTGADLHVPSEFELINPDHVIATLNEGAKLTMQMRIDVGRGYVSAERNKVITTEKGTIPIDSLFSPVIRCTHTVENTRVGQRTDFEKLTLEVETNGAIDPADAIASAGYIINEHMQLFLEQSQEQLKEEKEKIFSEAEDNDSTYKDTPIGDLHLSVRAYNCLMRQGIVNVGMLVECNENDLLNVRNFGAKSIEEVKDKLIEMGLSLKA